MSKHIEYKIHQNHNNNRKSNHQKTFISDEMIYVYATIINIFPLVTLTSSIKNILTIPIRIIKEEVKLI